MSTETTVAASPARRAIPIPRRRAERFDAPGSSTSWHRVLLHTVLIGLVVWSVLPFAWAVQTSIKYTRDVVAREPVLWGYEVTADAYRSFWFGNDQPMWPVVGYIVVTALVVVILAAIGRRSRVSWPWFTGVAAALLAALWGFPLVFDTGRNYDFFLNSIFVTVATVVISISIGLFAGYALARYTGISGAVILIAALGFRALPRTAFVLPYFFVANQFDLLDSRFVIVMALVAINQPFTIWMLRSFFMEVPRSIEEAAMMDGASRVQAFWRVIVPIMWPGIIATSLFTLLLAYNEFLFVRVLAVTEWTLPVAIVALTGGESTGTLTQAAAASVSITLPIVIVIVVFQKHLVKGLASGAVKG